MLKLAPRFGFRLLSLECTDQPKDNAYGCSRSHRKFVGSRTINATTGEISGGKQKAKVLSNADFYDEASKYLTTNTQFGASTRLDQVLSVNNAVKVIDIEFPTIATLPILTSTFPLFTFFSDNKLNHVKAHFYTTTKFFFMNSQKNLILIKRDRPSRTKGVMTLPITIGHNRDNPDSIANLSYDTLSKSECDRIVMNAEGNAVCFGINGKTIQMLKLVPRFGFRLSSITCSQDQAGLVKNVLGFYCPKKFNFVSSKFINASNGEISWYNATDFP
jgi:hypothetical protein